MLRITAQRQPAQTTLILEGRLCSDWVRELRNLPAVSEDSKTTRLTINLTAVTRVDDEGRALLMELHARGAELTGSGLAARAFVEDIVGPQPAPKKKRKGL